MTLRYFDSQGRQLTYEQLRSMNISTPVMEHIMATVIQRVTGNDGEESIAIQGTQVDNTKFV